MSEIRLYEGDADALMSGDHAERVSLLPGDASGFSAGAISSSNSIASGSARASGTR